MEFETILRLDQRCSVLQLQVHTSCLEQLPKKCALGTHRVSVLPPTAINNVDSDGFWEASKPPGTSPLLVFINSKSGDNQVRKPPESATGTGLDNVRHQFHSTPLSCCVKEKVGWLRADSCQCRSSSPSVCCR